VTVPDRDDRTQRVHLSGALVLVAATSHLVPCVLPGDCPYCVGDGPRPVGQAMAWPLVSGRSVRRGSRVKRDFACTLASLFPPLLVVLRARRA
jgi:hypothetical protein